MAYDPDEFKRRKELMRRLENTVKTLDKRPGRGEDPKPIKVAPYDPNEYIFRAELSRRLKIAVTTLDKWACRDEGPKPTKVGVAVRYLWGDVLHWLETGSR